MGRIIDADALKCYIVIHNVGCGCSDDYQKSFLESIDDQPTICPVRKGKWIKISPAGVYECSVCGLNLMTGDIDVYDWCHGCGAKMEEPEDIPIEYFESGGR